MMNKQLKNSVLALLLVALVALVAAGCGEDNNADTPALGAAPVISDPWARVTAPGAEMGAAYMNIHSAAGDKLVGVEVAEDIAARAELHETVMSDEMDSDHGTDESAGDEHEGEHKAHEESHEESSEGSTMKMQQVQSIELPAGQTVALKPGGYHVMLFDLAGPIEAGQKIALTLIFEHAGRQEVTAQAKN